MTGKDSVFIKLLEYGEQVGLDGSDIEAALAWARNEGLLGADQSRENAIKQAFFIELFNECFVQSNYNITTGKRVLTAEYYYRLIEHRELKEARQASKDANRNAFIAICLSIVAMSSSVYIGYQQLTNTVSLNPDQLETIITATNKPAILAAPQTNTAPQPVDTPPADPAP